MDVSRTIRVFVSSPSDVEAEARQLAVVIQELNSTLRSLVPERATALELIGWRTHVHPDVGREAQDVINRQLPDYDVYLGIMWSRFGTPTTVAASGTEEEFRDAYSGWQERKTPSHILFYFCQEELPPKVVMREIEQLKRIGEFRQELAAKGGLIWDYPSHAAFSETVRPHLASVVGEIIHAGKRPSGVGEGTALASTESDNAVVLERMRAFAAEYDDIRVRMGPGDERTRRMEVIATQMRTLGQSAVPILRQLAEDDSAGMRLAAIQTLQVSPDVDWVDWLADRLQGGTEKPFVGYHAAVALSAAARDLDDDALPRLRIALSRAEEAAQSLRADTDRAMALASAEQELRRREAPRRG